MDSLEARKIIFQMVKASAHMHQRGVIHRDIKPENMLLSRNNVLKICDFGSAKLFQAGAPLTEYMSTRWYRAPELLIIHNQYS